jgi:hypothetical protein
MTGSYGHLGVQEKLWNIMSPGVEADAAEESSAGAAVIEISRWRVIKIRRNVNAQN